MEGNGKEVRKRLGKRGSRKRWPTMMMTSRLAARLEELGCEVSRIGKNWTSCGMLVRPPGVQWWTKVWCRTASIYVPTSGYSRSPIAMWNMHVAGRTIGVGIQVVSLAEAVLVRRHVGAMTYKLRMVPGWKERLVARHEAEVVGDVDEAAPVVVEFCSRRRVRMIECSHCGHATTLGDPWRSMSTDGLLEAASSARIGCALCMRTRKDGHTRCCVLEVDGERVMSFQCKEPPKIKAQAALRRTIDLMLEGVR